MARQLLPHVVPALLAIIVFFTTLPFIESTMRLYSHVQDSDAQQALVLRYCFDDMLDAEPKLKVP